ncbi:hypothetical protein [Paraliobacillus ryukyuensis]|uniref:hypothetical protein n=1 Tax=Paraliobacillus ryukyuensis TaxID=200904 RepID=UPI0009A6571A|nr:hypothetical protein [Paraliobacillus ryukyuensis]
MDQLKEVFLEYQSIIGTLLGVVVTLTSSQLLKNVGSLRIYVRLFDLEFRNNVDEGWGSYQKLGAAEKNKASEIQIQTTLEVYNSSEVPKVFRDLSLCIYKNKELLLKDKLYDKSTERNGKISYGIDDINIINTPPKTIFELNLTRTIKVDEVKNILDFDSIYLEMKNHRGRVLKYRLK